MIRIQLFFLFCFAMISCPHRSLCNFDDPKKEFEIFFESKCLENSKKFKNISFEAKEKRFIPVGPTIYVRTLTLSGFVGNNCWQTKVLNTEIEPPIENGETAADADVEDYCGNSSYWFSVKGKAGQFFLDGMEVFENSESEHRFGDLYDLTRFDYRIHYGEIVPRKLLEVVAFADDHLDGMPCKVLSVRGSSFEPSVLDAFLVEYWFDEVQGKLQQKVMVVGEKFKRTIKYKYNGDSLRKIETFFARPANFKPVLETDIEYTSFQFLDSVPEDECFLSEYGFLEPENLTKNRWTWIQWVLIVIVAFVILIVGRKCYHWRIQKK